MICSTAGRRTGRAQVLRAVRVGLAAACATAAPQEPRHGSAASARRRSERARAGEVGLPALPLVGPPVAERRLVSVLFADLVGFTTLAEGRDAEDTRELLTPLLRSARDVDRPLRRHRREVHRRRGDGRVGRADRPRGRRRAGRAGRARAGRRGADAGPGHPGPRRRPDRRGRRHARRHEPGHGRRRPRQHRDPTPVRRAAPGTVLVGEATQRAAAKAIAFEAAGEQTLKGKASPVPAWRALRVVAEVAAGTAPRRSRRRSSAATTSCACSRTCSTPRAARDAPGSCRVIGPAASARPGSPGSSSSTSTGWSRRVWWHDGRSPAYGEGITLLGARRDGPRAAPACSRRTTRRRPAAKVAETLGEHVPDPDERRWIEPALLALLGIESRRRLGAAVRCLADVLRAARRHGARSSWSSRTSTSPTRACSTSSTTCSSGRGAVPIYVVTLSRPELLERRPDWGAGKRNFTSLLPRAAARAGDARAARRPRAGPAGAGG